MVFFFSYASKNDDAHVQKFFHDLERRMQMEAFLEPYGFRDKTEIKLGQEWESLILEALNGCQVLVALYSLQYFSESCGKECGVMLARQKEAPNPRNCVPIVPVIWYPVSDGQLPAALRRIQYSHDDFPREYYQFGLYDIMADSTLSDRHYQTILRTVGKMVADAARKGLPPLPANGLPTWKDAANAFSVEPLEPVPAVPLPTPQPLPAPERPDRRRISRRLLFIVIVVAALAIIGGAVLYQDARANAFLDQAECITNRNSKCQEEHEGLGPDVTVIKIAERCKEARRSAPWIARTERFKSLCDGPIRQAESQKR